MKRLVPTSEMTLGPFFPPEFAVGANDLSIGASSGEVIDITGRVMQVDGRMLDNVVLEIWQADAAGRYDNPNFLGWGRAATGANGEYRFRTIKPGAYPGRTPHINFLILYSGLMRQLQTVMFLENGEDPVLQTIELPELRQRLIARRDGDHSYRFDIRLRGEGETPFFDD